MSSNRQSFTSSPIKSQINSKRLVKIKSLREQYLIQEISFLSQFKNQLFEILSDMKKIIGKKQENVKKENKKVNKFEINITKFKQYGQLNQQKQNKNYQKQLIKSENDCKIIQIHQKILKQSNKLSQQIQKISNQKTKSIKLQIDQIYLFNSLQHSYSQKIQFCQKCISLTQSNVQKIQNQQKSKQTLLKITNKIQRQTQKNIKMNYKYLQQKSIIDKNIILKNRIKIEMEKINMIYQKVRNKVGQFNNNEVDLNNEQNKFDKYFVKNQEKNILIQNNQTMQSSTVNNMTSYQKNKNKMTNNNNLIYKKNNSFSKLVSSAEQMYQFFNQKNVSLNFVQINKQILQQKLYRTKQKISHLTKLNKDLQQKLAQCQKFKAYKILERKIKQSSMLKPLSKTRITKKYQKQPKMKRSNRNSPLSKSRYIHQSDHSSQQSEQILELDQMSQINIQRSEQMKEDIVYQILAHEFLSKKIKKLAEIGFKGIQSKKNYISKEQPLLRSLKKLQQRNILYSSIFPYKQV